jgi:hypothetical protein
MRTRYALLVPLLVPLLAALTACGSTVPMTTTATGSSDGLTASDGATVGGLSPEGTTSTGGGTSGGTSGVVRGTGSGSGGSASTGGSGAGARPTTGSSGGSAGAGFSTTGAAAPGATGPIPTKGRGWDAKTVSIGVVTQNDSAAAFAALGAKGVDPGNTEAQAKAVAADLNAKGGVYGRQVKLVFRDVATVDTATNPDTTGNSVCTFFTQDSPVVAVLSIVTVMDVASFRACLAKARVPLFNATANAIDDQAGRSLAPYFYQSLGVSWDALAPVLVSRLQAQGWFGGWNTTLGKPGTGKAKVGILTDSTEVGIRVSKTVRNAFVRAGYPDTVTFQYAKASNLSPAVNYFKGNGVTHLVVTDIQLTAFQGSAGQQQYHPRYGITTYNDPYSNLETSDFSPAGANVGAMGVGWAPNFDVGPANDPAPSVGAKSCLAVMSKGGQTFSGKRLAQAFASSICDGMYLTVKGAVAGHGLDGAAIGNGVALLGSTYSPANGFQAALTPSKRFVSGLARDVSYVEGCSCFRYGPGSGRL